MNQLWIEYGELLGEIKCNHPINGLGLIFKFGYDNYRNECILFVHPTLDSFVSVDDKEIDPNLLCTAILSKWSKNELLKLKNESTN